MKQKKSKRLEFSNFKLNYLLDITRAINENYTVDELLKRFERLLIDELNIGKVLLFKKTKKWEQFIISGIDEASIEAINVETDLCQYKKMTRCSLSKDEKFQQFDLIIPVSHKDQILAYALIGDKDKEEKGVSPTIKHQNFIDTIANIIIVAIENKRLAKENIDQEKIRQEFLLASKMQSMLIPNKNSLPNNEKINTASFYLPHFEVGGDYYDFIELNENEIGFCIADVSGKGISAAILMSNFQATLRALFTTEINLPDLMVKLNKTVLDNAKGEKFLTLFIAKYNYQTRELEYINAAHNPPLLYEVKNKKMKYLTKGCVGIGMLDEIPKITLGYEIIQSKSKLLCFTDGLVEMEYHNNIEFEADQLEEYFEKDLNIEKTIDSIIKKLNIRQRQETIFDDISIIGIEFF